MKRKDRKIDAKGTGRRRTARAAALVMAAALSATAALTGCSKSGSPSDPSGQKDGAQNVSTQDDGSMQEDGPAQGGGAMDTDAHSDPKGAAADGEGVGEGGDSPQDTGKGAAALEDGNLAALLGTSVDDIERKLGKYDGDLESSKTIGVLAYYPGLNIQLWNGTGEICQVTLLDTENADWNIFGIRPGDRMDEARDRVASLGGKKEQTGDMYGTSENYRLTYQEQTMHVQLSDGGSGGQVETVQVFFDVNDMLGVDVQDDPWMDGMGGSGGDDPHIAHLQEQYPDALVSTDSMDKIQYQEEWLEASVYIVMDLAKGEDLMFAYTPDGKTYRMEEGEWKLEK